MKKLLLVCSLFLAALNVNAQSLYEHEFKHDIFVNWSLTGGFILGEKLSEYAEMLDELVSFYDGEILSINAIGGKYTIGYNYHFPNNLTLGAAISFSRYSLTVLPLGSTNIASVSADVISTLVTMRTNWFNHKYVAMYSKFGIGLISYHGDARALGFGASGWVPFPLPTAHISPVCIEAGNPRVRFFAELGFGSQGLLQSGIRVGL